MGSKINNFSSQPKNKKSFDKKENKKQRTLKSKINIKTVAADFHRFEWGNWLD